MKVKNELSPGNPGFLLVVTNKNSDKVHKTMSLMILMPLVRRCWEVSKG